MEIHSKIIRQGMLSSASAARSVAAQQPSYWRGAAEAHRERILSLIGGPPQDVDLRHPVLNFLFTYYKFDVRALLKWSPGMDVVLSGVGVAESDLWTGRGWRVSTNGGSGFMDPTLCKPSLRRSARRAADVMRRTAGRTPHLNCYGLHEWAMLYRPAGAPQPCRHQDLPLRLSQQALNQVVESVPIACTHFDAFRFFTPGAVPLNTVAPEPTRANQPQMEQPGCVHASMDCFRYAIKLWPWIPAELLADSLEVALKARVLDMRASPYDLSAWDRLDGLDLSPVLIETADGRRQYQREQAWQATCAAPVRARILREYERAIVAWDSEEASDSSQTHALGDPARRRGAA